MTFEFQEWPKIARLNRDMIVTEKIDGTNACIVIQEAATGWEVGAQSRSRIITPQDDNFGFARWVQFNRIALTDALGPGYHFGEWWGSGIQRGYGLPKGEKRFSLFNTSRWADELWKSENEGCRVEGLGVVPVLYEGPFDNDYVNWEVDDLRDKGSRAAPGFDNPEGVVVFHKAANLCFKVTIKDDEVPKGQVA